VNVTNVIDTGAAHPKKRREKIRDYQPPEPTRIPPLFVWPFNPTAFLKWVFAFPGYLWPWNTLYLAIALVSFFYLTADMARMTRFEFDWVGLIFLRNVGLIIAVVGAWHLWLYVKRAQGTEYKYNGRWLAKDNDNFLFRDQLLDNLFWTFVSAVPIWTAYEVVTLWAQANGYIPRLDFAAHPFYGVALLLVIPVFREAHFYVIHRLIHWPPLYRTVHKLHHNNINPGPWSGLSMHPVEHLLYFSGVLLHWILPSHPLHVIFHLQHLAFSPSQGHNGFDKVVIGDKTMSVDHYTHYLHHKYFEVNYGDGLVPLDRWFGTFHDGTEEAHEAMNRRVLKQRSDPA
jgi:sterol desaturase/sphingolipid hydroxylase (fatty acid hydroxylase superfamily)